MDREVVIAANKTRSLTEKKPVPVRFGDEEFVFVQGKLVEYTRAVPLEMVAEFNRGDK